MHIGGQVVNTTQQLAAALSHRGSGQRSGAQLQPFDHVLAPAGETLQKTQAGLEEGTALAAVLYGAIGTPCFAQLHAQLLAAAAETGALSCMPDDTAAFRAGIL